MLGGLAEVAFGEFRRTLASVGITAPLYVTQNDGTVVLAEVAAANPVYSFASGPTNSMRGAAFLTGIGEVFPYIRSHNVLNNLQSVVVGRPMLMFFPGRYEQSDTLGSSLVLFGRLKDDQYYRAKNILEQEP